MKKTSSPFVQFCLFVFLAIGSAHAAQVVAPTNVHYWTTNYSTSSGPSGIWLANVRGQKTWRDLVVANKNSNSVSIRLCRDAGNFNSTAISYTVDSQPVAVIGTDLNRDNYDDVVSANFGTNTISILPNKKNNTFGAATNYVVGSISNPGPVALAAGNAAGSGRQDIFVANLLENSVTVLTNAGNCVLSVRSNISVGTGPIAIAFVDFNGDGTGDIITANTNGTISILQGNGGADFTSYTNLTLFEGGDPQPAALATGDFNGDGRIDLVVANYQSNSITILTNSFGTTFLVSTSYDVGTSPRALTVRNLNPDAYPDIAVANENSSDVYAFLGDANGTFSLSTVTSVGANPVGIAASNFNSDNMSDLAVVCFGANTTSILLYDLPLVYNTPITVYEDVPKSITLSAVQLTNAALTYTIVSSPVHGDLTGTGPTYTYTPETNYFGADSFTYSVNDGTSDSATGTNTLTIYPVNDAPTFGFSTNVIQAQKFVTLTVSNFIATSSPGPANEAGQKISFLTTLLSKTNLFLTRPTIQTNGTLTFKPSTNNFGTSVVTIVAQDGGGRYYGGSNQSYAQTFVIENLGTNPFPSLKGSYYGLFSEAAGITPNTAGSFSFSLSIIGAYSGTLTHMGVRYGFAGQFNKDGTSQCTIAKPGLTCTLAFQLDVSNNTDRVTGTITTVDWTADLLGDRLTFDGIGNLAPAAGKYTLSIPGSTGSSTYPNGDSYGALSISTAGKVTYSGYMADGLGVTQTSYVSKNGAIPCYAPLFSGVGILSGWLTANSGLTGSLTWSPGDYYSEGWNTNATIIGSTYTPPAVGTRIVDLTNVVITLRDGGLTTPLTNNATLTINNTFTYSGNTNRIALVLYTSNGTVVGGFRHPETLQNIALRGVVLQEQKKIEGFFNASGISGHWEIAAP